MTKAIAASALGLLALSLGACDGAEREASDSISKAEGEILERSVTDDMLPYDSLRSQPPLADPEEAEKADKARKARAADGGQASGQGDSPGEAQVPGPEPVLPGASPATPDAE